MDDPLDAIEQLPAETQIAVIVSVLRSTRNQLGRIERKLDWVSRSIWTLIATIIAGIIVYSLTTGQQTVKTHPAVQPPALTRQAARP